MAKLKRSPQSNPLTLITGCTCPRLSVSLSLPPPVSFSYPPLLSACISPFLPFFRWTFPFMRLVPGLLIYPEVPPSPYRKLEILVDGAFSFACPSVLALKMMIILYPLRLSFQSTVSATICQRVSESQGQQTISSSAGRKRGINYLCLTAVKTFGATIMCLKSDLNFFVVCPIVAGPERFFCIHSFLYDVIFYHYCNMICRWKAIKLTVLSV